jgi:hypothetical protein
MTKRSSSDPDGALHDPEATLFYGRVLRTLEAAGVPFLIGGAYAFRRYTGIVRDTKDLDIFVRRRDIDRTLRHLADAGYGTDLAFPHWLGKVQDGDRFVDVIFGAGNGIAEVDEAWFDHGIEVEVLGVEVRLAPPEEMIWSKAFIMERERYDGADVAHVIRAIGRNLDWTRLMARFEPHWRVLLSHLVLFSFIYPSERTQVPVAVIRELMARLEADLASWGAPTEQVCQGTMLSREQYLSDVQEWGYEDARLSPRGRMSTEDLRTWTAAIEADPPK